MYFSLKLSTLLHKSCISDIIWGEKIGGNVRNIIAIVIGISVIVITAIVASYSFLSTTRSGLLYEKVLDPAHWGTLPIGKIIVPHWYEDRWYFYLQDCPSGQLETWPGVNCKTGTFEVSHEAFNSFEPGSRVSFGPADNLTRIALGGLAGILLVSGAYCVIIPVYLVEKYLARILFAVTIEVAGVVILACALFFVQQLFAR